MTDLNVGDMVRLRVRSSHRTSLVVNATILKCFPASRQVNFKFDGRRGPNYFYLIDDERIEVLEWPSQTPAT